MENTWEKSGKASAAIIVRQSQKLFTMVYVTLGTNFVLCSKSKYPIGMETRITKRKIIRNVLFLIIGTKT